MESDGTEEMVFILATHQTRNSQLSPTLERTGPNEDDNTKSITCFSHLVTVHLINPFGSL